MIAAVRAGAAMIARGASGTPVDAPDHLVTTVYRAVGDDACLVEQPPPGCDLKDHTPELEAMLTGAGLGLPATCRVHERHGPGGRGGLRQ